MAPFMFIQRASLGVPVTQYGDGSSSRDFTYIDDIVDGVLHALDRPNGHQIFNLGRGMPTSLSDFIAIVAAAVGRLPVVDVLPPQPGDVPRTCADVSKAKQLLDYRPKVDLAEGIRRTVAWFNSEYGAGRADHGGGNGRNNGGGDGNVNGGDNRDVLTEEALRQIAVIYQPADVWERSAAGAVAAVLALSSNDDTVLLGALSSSPRLAELARAVPMPGGAPFGSWQASAMAGLGPVLCLLVVVIIVLWQKCRPPLLPRRAAAAAAGNSSRGR
ncbi:unnamed protein product [Phaeothamnion confervicola]